MTPFFIQKIYTQDLEQYFSSSLGLHCVLYVTKNNFFLIIKEIFMFILGLIVYEGHCFVSAV